MASQKISLKLLVDKEKNRVVFAESGKDFVDVLLSFLTLPMGTIIRLCSKEAKIGCMNALYESVEALDLQYFQTEACKSMLLNPRMERESEDRCFYLVQRIDEINHDIIYICPNCSSPTGILISMFKNSKCHCGRDLDSMRSLYKTDPDEVFVKGMSTYMIGDNLSVTPASTTTCLAFLSQLQVSDSKAVEERNVTVGREEILHLLKRSLLSKTPLRDVFLDAQEELMDPFVLGKIEPLGLNHSDGKNISLKLLLSKSNNKVIYAESKGDFLDLLFSFLTFPVGSILKLLGGCTSLASIDNLYKCVETLSNDDYTILEERKELLLSPKVAYHYGITNQLLQIQEANSWSDLNLKCPTCLESKTENCLHGFRKEQLTFVNPKFVNTVTESGGGYIKPSSTFMVTDDLVVKPFSPVNGISLVSDFGVPFSDLQEKVVTIGEHEASSLLKASLTSKNVLSEVFAKRSESSLDRKKRNPSEKDYFFL